MLRAERLKEPHSECASVGGQGNTVDSTQLNCCWADFLPAVDADEKAAPVGTAGLSSFPLVDVNVLVGLSASGLRGMAGNVWQWCRDSYDADFYSKPAATAQDAWNNEPHAPKAERGGSWVGPPTLARSSYRRGRVPEASGRCLGFRCVGPIVEELTRTFS